MISNIEGVVIAEAKANRSLSVDLEDCRLLRSASEVMHHCTVKSCSGRQLTRFSSMAQLTEQWSRMML